MSIQAYKCPDCAGNILKEEFELGVFNCSHCGVLLVTPRVGGIERYNLPTCDLHYADRAVANWLAQNLSMEELKQLCFDCGVDHEGLADNSITTGLARSLWRHLSRRNALDELAKFIVFTGQKPSAEEASAVTVPTVIVDSAARWFGNSHTSPRNEQAVSIDFTDVELKKGIYNLVLDRRFSKSDLQTLCFVGGDVFGSEDSHNTSTILTLARGMLNTAAKNKSLQKAWELIKKELPYLTDQDLKNTLSD